jgi:methyl-accepting chemotaxis protein
LVPDELVTESGRYFITQGILGVLCILFIAVIGFLYSRLVTCMDARVQDTERLAVALERQSTSNASVAIAVETRTQMLADIAKVVAEIAKQIESESDRGREKLDIVIRKMERFEQIVQPPPPPPNRWT